MDAIDFNFKKFSELPPSKCDIGEHLNTLKNYAATCSHVTECGVRRGISSWAFFKGLSISEKTSKRLISVDIDDCKEKENIASAARKIGIKYTFMRGSDLKVAMEETDLMFIDTWHVYGQLRRELARLAPFTRKYIIMHDTTVDEITGESLRMKHNIR